MHVSELRLYRCHCSLCRMNTGTASNCAAVVDIANFEWLKGSETIASWTKSTGYRTDFCNICGSPVPRPLSLRNALWVPAGSLQNPAQAEIVADFEVASRASWDHGPLAASQHAGFPSAQEFFELMHPQ